MSKDFVIMFYNSLGSRKENESLELKVKNYVNPESLTSIGEDITEMITVQ